MNVGEMRGGSHAEVAVPLGGEADMKAPTSQPSKHPLSGEDIRWISSSFLKKPSDAFHEPEAAQVVKGQSTSATATALSPRGDVPGGR